MSFNQVVLIGRVGQDAEVSEVGSTTLAKFTMATSESWRDKSGEKKETTEWHSIEVWGKMAEAVGKWIEKGRELCVVGKITTQTWEKDGKKNYKTVIRAHEVKFVGAKPEGSKKRSDADDDDAPRRGRGRAEQQDDDGDNIPF